MRISGDRGHEGWLIAISVSGLLVAASLSNGGVDGLLSFFEGAVRQVVAALVGFVRYVF